MKPLPIGVWSRHEAAGPITVAPAPKFTLTEGHHDA